MHGLLGLILAGLALAGSPGPNTLSLTAAGAAFGLRRVLAYMIGIDLGMLIVIVIVATGTLGVVMAIPGVAPVVTAISVVYFIYLAYRIATAPPLSDEGPTQRQPPSFAAGVMLSLINPKGYAAMAALFSGFPLEAASPAIGIAIKIVALNIIIVAVNIAWLIAGAAMTRLFRDPKTNRIVNIGFAVVLLASVAFALR